MRILICTNAYPPHFMGGAELVAHHVARELVRLGHQIAVFAGEIAPEAAHHTLRRDRFQDVPVYRVGTVPRDFNPATGYDLSIANEAAFAEVVEEFAPDLVHAHNLTGLSLRIPLLAAERGLRVFVTLHDYWGFCLRNTQLRPSGLLCDDRSACAGCLGNAADAVMLARLRRDTLALSFDRVEAFFAPSRHLADQYIDAGFPAERMIVVRNGIDVMAGRDVLPHPLLADRGGRDVTLLYAGYLGQHKGLVVLIEAMALMRHRAAVRLDLVGDGPVEQRLRDQAAWLGLADQVRFRGKFQPEAMAAIHAASDILVLPSLWPENQPVCVMEAMAAGHPVVASAIGGVAEQITSGIEGILVGPGNARALADALDRLVEQPDLRRSMGEAGRARVLGYGYREQALALEAVFAGPIRPGPSAPDRVLAALPDREMSSGVAEVPDYVLVRRNWLTRAQAAAVRAFVLPTGSGWRLRLARVLAGRVYDPDALPWWRRAVVRHLLN